MHGTSVARTLSQPLATNALSKWESAPPDAASGLLTITKRPFFAAGVAAVPAHSLSPAKVANMEVPVNPKMKMRSAMTPLYSIID
jgi:hypothetical protein